MLQRVAVPALTIVTVLSSTVFVMRRPAAGDAISDAKAKAAAIESQLQHAQNEMSALSQQYDPAKYHLSQINSNIATTKATIVPDQKQVADDKTTLAKAAVANYISDGSAASQNPLFAGNDKTLGASTEYNRIAEGRHQTRGRQPPHGGGLSQRPGEPASGRAVAGAEPGERRAERGRAEPAGDPATAAGAVPGAG